RNGRLTGGVDVGEHQHVGLVEGAAEFLPQMLRARVAMWVEEHQQTIELANAGSFQRGPDFGGVMAVIIDYRDVVDGAFDVEAAADAREFAEAFADQFRGNVEIERDSCCSGGVAHIVDAWRMEELENAEVVAFVGQAKFAAQTFELDVADDEIGLAGSTVGDDRALDVGNDGLDVGLIQAKNRRAVKGDAIDELHEGVLNVFERRILIEMLAVDGGDDRDHRRKQQEAAVALVGFDHKEFAFAEPSGGAGLIDATADNKCRIEMRGRKHRSHDGCCRGLSMRAGYRDAVLQAHQLRQHFGARYDWDFFLVRFGNFRIVRFDRGRSHYHMRAFDICGFVAFVNRGAEILQAFGDVRWLGV